MASSTTKHLAKRLSTIADGWVQDIFRPHLQIQTFLKSLAQHPRLTSRTVEAARAIKDNEMKKKVRSWRIDSYMCSRVAVSSSRIVGTSSLHAASLCSPSRRVRKKCPGNQTAMVEGLPREILVLHCQVIPPVRVLSFNIAQCNPSRLRDTRHVCTEETQSLISDTGSKYCKYYVQAESIDYSLSSSSISSLPCRA